MSFLERIFHHAPAGSALTDSEPHPETLELAIDQFGFGPDQISPGRSAADNASASAQPWSTVFARNA